jgi:hypothetical protein
MHGDSMRNRSALLLRSSLAVQRAQRDFVREHREYEQDYRTGMAVARKYFGRHLAVDVRRKLVGDLPGALRDLATLIRHDPRGATLHLWRARRA